MKKHDALLKLFILLIMIPLFSSCTRELLVSREGIRNLDLVKVESQDRQPVNKEKPAGQPTSVTAEAIPEQPLEQPSEINVSQVQAKELERQANIPVTNRQIRKLVSQQAHAMDVASQGKSTANQTDKRGINPLKKGHQLQNKQSKEGQTTQNPGSDLLRILLYVLIALLIISILGILLPGYLVGIVVLVLLIAVLIYLLGGL
jgi:hypothetical protein